MEDTKSDSRNPTNFKQSKYRVYMQAGRNERLPLNKLEQLDFQLISQQQKWKPED